jgi:hypothetical protein
VCDSVQPNDSLGLGKNYSLLKTLLMVWAPNESGAHFFNSKAFEMLVANADKRKVMRNAEERLTSFMRWAALNRMDSNLAEVDESFEMNAQFFGESSCRSSSRRQNSRRKGFWDILPGEPNSKAIILSDMPFFISGNRVLFRLEFLQEFDVRLHRGSKNYDYLGLDMSR